MKSNAPGQLLGYALQFPRAFFHLLKSGPGDFVCVEVLGDVATIKSDSSVISEEDKSSTGENPLTDRSTDLWKTFSNWIKAIKSGDLDVGKTKFLLYCNKSGRDGIVNNLNSAQNKNEAQSAINDAKKVLTDIKEGHAIWEYYDFVINNNESLLLDVIERFELQIGKGSGYDELHREIQRKLVPESQIEFLVNNISGWLLKMIAEKIKANQLAIIRWEEFSHQFKVLFDRARRFELIDFTLQNPPEKDTIEQQVKIRPLYLRQLESVDASDDEILEAVSDYLRADVNRYEWIEREIIDEVVAADFDSRLKQFWQNQKKRIEITEQSLDKKIRGRLLFADCKIRQETIRDATPPASTIAGTYHALANEPVLGWHTDWEQLFLSVEGE